MHHQERQSENISDLSDLSAKDVYSPPWMKDLIIKKREKLVDIVNGVAKQEHTTQLNYSKGGKTSIGSNTSITTVGNSAVRVSPKASSGAFTNCCLSCLSQGDDWHCSCESGFNSKAVHLNSNANVPNVRSVSSSLVTGPPCSRCLVSDSILCVNHLQSESKSTSNDSSNCVHKSNQFHKSFLKCCSSQPSQPSQPSLSSQPSQLIHDLTGLVAKRKKQILKRQVSESSYFYKTCNICGTKTYAPNNQYCWQSFVSQNMIDDKIKDKIKDDDTEYYNNDRNHHHYEVIIDYKRSNSVNSSEKDSSLSNDMESDENEYEYKYGPGIVDKLKLKFMNISIQQTNNMINNKLKRCSSLENIVVSNDSHIYQSQRSLQPQHLGRNKQSQANDLLPLLGKDSAVVNVRSLTDGGNRANGNQLSHRLYIQQHNSRNNYINNKSTACVPTIKRAKSMDTLVFQDDNDKGRQPSNCSFHHQISMPETPISNDLQLVDENVLIIENTNNFINQCQNRTSDDKLIQSTMKSASNLNNEPIDELPKPDTVKTYKRIFEPMNMTNGEEITGINNKSKNNYKKTQTQTPTNGNIKRKPPVLRATDKIASQKTQSIVNSLSPTIKPQPPAVPQVLSSSHSISDSAVVGDNDKNNNKSANTPVMTKPPIAPKNIALSSIKSNPFSGMSAAPINKYFKKNGSFANTKRAVHYSSNDNNNITTGPKKPERGLKSVSTEALDRIRASGTSVTFTPRDQSSTPCPISQTSATAHDSSDSTPNKPKVNKPIANIKPFTQNNNSKSKIVDNCQSVISDYNGSDLGHDKPLENEKPIGEKASVETNYTNNNNNKDDKENNKIAPQSVIPTTTPTLTSTTDLIEKSNNENSVSVNDENVSPNTYDMVDRNKVQRIEDHTQTDVLKPSLLLNTGHSNNTSNKSPTSSLWSQETKKPTTVVFDFRGKDVKSNLAIHPAPFGLSTSATKKTPKDGSINSNGSVDEDDDDNYTGSLDIPLPSGITFTGENVKVGKGSMLSTRNKKLNIQFNDSATSTYEYPSEASLLAETPISSHTSTLEEVNYENKSETNNSVIACESSNTNTTLTTLKTNLALGGSSGGLASYKPTLIDTPFELGVSRTTKSHPKSETAVNEHNSETNTEVDSVKPANPDETTSWSTSSTASDLLF